MQTVGIQFHLPVCDTYKSTEETRTLFKDVPEPFKAHIHLIDEVNDQLLAHFKPDIETMNRKYIKKWLRKIQNSIPEIEHDKYPLLMRIDENFNLMDDAEFDAQIKEFITQLNEAKYGSEIQEKLTTYEANIAIVTALAKHLIHHGKCPDIETETTRFETDHHMGVPFNNPDNNRLMLEVQQTICRECGEKYAVGTAHLEQLFAEMCIEHNINVEHYYAFDYDVFDWVVINAAIHSNFQLHSRYQMLYAGAKALEESAEMHEIVAAYEHGVTIICENFVDFRNQLKQKMVKAFNELSRRYGEVLEKKSDLLVYAWELIKIYRARIAEFDVNACRRLAADTNDKTAIEKRDHLNTQKILEKLYKAIVASTIHTDVVRAALTMQLLNHNLIKIHY